MKNILFLIITAFTGLSISAQPSKTELVKLLGKFPKPPKLNVDTMEKTRLESGFRYKIKFLSEDSNDYFHTPKDFIQAYLFIPDHKPNAKMPAIVAIHQDGPHSYFGKSEPAGISGDTSLFYGLELFKRGYVVICPDRYYHANRRRINNPDTLDDVWQEEAMLASEHWAGQLLMSGRTSAGKETYDLMRAVDVLYQLDCVDKKRVGAIGHSAGGYALGYFMFMDQRVKLGVSSCGIFELANFYDENAAMKRRTYAVIPGLAGKAKTAYYVANIAPRPLLMTRGLWEWGTDDSIRIEYSKMHVNETKQIEKVARVYYKKAKADKNLKTIYFEDGNGNHSFPYSIRMQAYDWIDSYFKITHEL